MSQNRSCTQYQRHVRAYEGGKGDRGRLYNQHMQRKFDVIANNLVQGFKGLFKEKLQVPNNKKGGISRILGVQKIDKRWFFIKYILLMLFFITYGSILITLKETDSKDKIMKVQQPPTAEINYNSKPSNSSSKYQQQLIKTQANRKVEQSPIQRVIQIENNIQPKQISPHNQHSQPIQDELLQIIMPQSLLVEKQQFVMNQQLQQQSYNSPQHQSDSNFPVAISRTEQSIVRDIISTYQDNHKRITRAQQQLPSKNAQAINSIKKEFKQKEQNKINRTYDNFEDKIQQTSGQGRTILFQLQLFPFLRPWATTPRSTTKFERFASIFKGIFVSETYLWDNLYEMLDTGGYWESKGDLLTVATYSKVIDDQFGSLQIYTPTIIRLWFPYDIPSNETITFTGIRMRYDLHSKVQTRWISEYLGELYVKPTQQERKRRQPIQRVFYCQQQGCNYLYSLVQLRSNNNIRLHFLQIDSIFSVGR